MKKEYSYGAFVYKIDEGVLYTLIEYMKLGHVSIPKGHIEDGETPVQCAVREIKEETGLDVEIDDTFSYEINYSPSEGVTKRVVFYLAEYNKNQKLKAQEIEVNSLKWVTVQQALKELTYDSDKEVVRAAKKELDERYKAELI